MKIKIFSLSLLALSPLFFSSCSVAMAAKKEGVSLEKVQNSRCRGQLLAKGATIISSERLPNGELVEVYQFKKEKGSAARAFMHGVLDVSTCGLWEVVGTPMEASLSEETYYAVKIFYDAQENVIRMELL